MFTVTAWREHIVMQLLSPPKKMQLLQFGSMS